MSKPILAASIGVFSVLCLLIFAAGQAKPSGQVVPASALSGKPAPSISGTSQLDGSQFDLAALRGSFVVINFFADWCTECRLEHKDLLSFAQQPSTTIPTQVVQVIRNNSTSLESSLDYLNREGHAWPAIYDADGSIALRFGVRGQPESFIVNPDGIVLGVYRGPIQKSQLADAINEHTRQAQMASNNG